MIRSSLIVLIAVLPAAIALAAAPVDRHESSPDARPLAGATLGVTAVDTTLLVGPWGSGAPFNGQFQSPSHLGILANIRYNKPWGARGLRNWRQGREGQPSGQVTHQRTANPGLWRAMLQARPASVMLL